MSMDLLFSWHKPLPLLVKIPALNVIGNQKEKFPSPGLAGKRPAYPVQDPYWRLDGPFAYGPSDGFYKGFTHDSDYLSFNRAVVTVDGIDGGQGVMAQNAVFDREYGAECFAVF